MKRWKLSMAAGIALSAIATVSSAAGIIEKTRAFYVTYGTGTGETILVRYEGHLDHRQQNRGTVAKPFKGKFVDDRRCEWSIETYVTRAVFFVSKSGRMAAFGQVSRVWSVQKNDTRGPRDAVQALGYHRTCGDVQGTIQNQVAQARSLLLERFDEVVAADAREVETDLKDYLKPVALRPTATH